jgi:transposase
MSVTAPWEGPGKSGRSALASGVHPRRRRAKTDRIDGEALVRALLAYKRGEPRVCAMVKAPTPEEEDRRRPVARKAVPFSRPAS